MAKRKRNPRAQNKIEGTFEGGLIPVEPEPFPDTPAQVYRTQSRAITRSTLFTAEFEAVIEIIAIDRVYRAMRERFGRHLLTGPPEPPDEPPRIEG